jgi:WLM domain
VNVIPAIAARRGVRRRQKNASRYPSLQRPWPSSKPADRVLWLSSYLIYSFISALKGPDEQIANDILHRIAAKVVPIMKNHGMDVMSLEEFEANREFVGRYFPGGSLI